LNKSLEKQQKPYKLDETECFLNLTLQTENTRMLQ